MEGIHHIKPVITKVAFNSLGKITIFLKDGRQVTAPLRYFPGIKKLSAASRKRYRIVNDQIIMFSEANEVYHLQDFLGKEQEYRYAG
jgi:hypothetical protein